MTTHAADWMRTIVARVSAKIGSLEKLGTAFLVSPHIAITCAHCVQDGDELATDVHLHFTQATGTLAATPVGASVLGTTFDRSLGIDFAVLALAVPLRTAPIVLFSARPPQGDMPWVSFGHALATTRPFWMRGAVAGLSKPSAAAEGTLIELNCNEASISLQGVSGSPVFVEQRLVGVISEQLWTAGASSDAPGIMKVYAAPIAGFLQSSLARHLHTSKRVFIAYRRGGPGADLATELKARLEADGHSVFIDTTIHVGTDWVGAIDDELARCQFFIPIVSDETFGSEVFLREIETAYRRRIASGTPRILAVRTDEDRPTPYLLRLYLGRWQYLNWRSRADNASICKELAAAVSAHEVPAAMEIPRVTPSKPPELTALPQAGPLDPHDPYFVMPLAAERVQTTLTNRRGGRQRPGLC